MKKLFLIVVILFYSNLISGQTINLMTYNLRYDNPKDGENNWANRKDFLLSQIKYYEPDIFGTQEGLEHQVTWINENLDNYKFVGVGRNEDGGGEYSALFYNFNKFEILESNTFWLSETPSIPSKGWDAALNRICTYALIKDIANGNKFWIFNTHFDHKGNVAKAKSAELILQKMELLNTENYPAMLMGDFNLEPDEKPILEISKILNDSKVISVSTPFGPDETFCGFDICQPNKFRIDYIFTTKTNIIVNKYAVLANIKNMSYPSDHFPVMINVKIKNK